MQTSEQARLESMDRSPSWRRGRDGREWFPARRIDRTMHSLIARGARCDIIKGMTGTGLLPNPDMIAA